MCRRAEMFRGMGSIRAVCMVGDCCGFVDVLGLACRR